MQQNKNYPPALNAFIHDIATESQDNYHNRLSAAVAPDDPEVTDEERRARDFLSGLNYSVTFAAEKYFDGYISYLNINHLPLSALLMAPSKLGNHQYLGINAIMRMLNAITADDAMKVQYTTEEIMQWAWRESAPTVRGLAKFFSDDYSKKEYRLSELYWLMKLCTWLHCITPDFSTNLQKVLSVGKDSEGEPLDFTKVLTPSLVTDAVLINSATRQYTVLEQLLHRIA